MTEATDRHVGEQLSGYLDDELTQHGGGVTPRHDAVQRAQAFGGHGGSEVAAELDQLLIRNGRGAIFELDDLRLGESWESVVRP